ncbi:MAG TPA: maleylpyruvate isomerase family mycothiol-dependent enzyme [Actinophytocola sp.]|uniref:maleylpyruvate isomerase family mycothiol-dependent enzyme n=1 Tax=Actinophytocola sp. TaxID=1872138 RepID=UPI002DBB5936|nr:maleylpyruvate isomerase family mycothiol-dependent enzyme [Actinophytocola sp.]HEU5471285.1 maleylpyruvate isomerase family mycothiol-dependent enzyme [Actinophytocola sp.]
MDAWNFMDPASRDNLRRAIQTESDGMFALVEDPAFWEAPTAAGEWQARDVIGHLVDTTESYFVGFDAARGRGEPNPGIPLGDMATAVDAGARRFRDLSRDELIARLRTDREKLTGIFDGLTDEEWTSLLVPHTYMGPLPAFFYPIFQVVDYAVHNWDIRQGIGQPHALSAEAADLLVPLNFVLWSATARAGAFTEHAELGIRVASGVNAGEHKVTTGPDGVAIEPGPVDGLPAVLEFDPASLVLTAFGRMNAGTARGDLALANRFLGGFFRI